MYCVKCGKEINSDNKFCTFCGTPIDSNEINATTSTTSYSFKNKKKQYEKKGKKNIIIIFSIIIILLIIAASTSGNNSSNSSSNKDTVENTTSDKGSTNYNNIVSKYELLEDIDEMPLTISQNAKNFLKENGNLFPTQNYSDIDLSLIDTNIDYKQISKNQDNYGDKLIELNNAYVLSIYETVGDNNEYVTEIHVLDENENSYYIIYFGQLEDVYQESIIKVIGLPLGNTSFSNVSGGTTLAVALAGSYIQLIK